MERSEIFHFLHCDRSGYSYWYPLQFSDSSFVLIKGRAMIDDYQNFANIATNFSELDEIFGQGANTGLNSKIMEIILF